MKERYTNNVGYWYPQLPHIKGELPKWSSEGTPFKYNNLGNRKDTHQNQASVIRNISESTWRTDTQKDFKAGDRVSTERIPMNNAERKDYSIIIRINETPFNENGNRHRSVKLIRKDLIVS